jgi:hypothetical protein
MTSFAFDGAHGTSTRPAHKPAVQPWAKDESAPGLNDGTRLTASWANAISANLRHLLTHYDVTGDEHDDTLLRRAIDIAIATGIAGLEIDDVPGLTAALAAKAPLASPTFTGTPSAPTAGGGTNTTQLATTAFVQAAIAALLNSAPGALDTLDELAAALGDDANFASTMTTALAGKAAKSANLSDLTDAAAARTNLGLAIGANVQAYNARLAELAAISWVHGDLAYFNGSALVRLAPGTAGHLLQTGGAGANPSWAAPATGSPEGSDGDIQTKSGSGFAGASWRFSSGHLQPPSDNTVDIGASGASRPRHVYIGNTLTVGDNGGTFGKVNIGIGFACGLYFGNRGSISAHGDGNFQFFNNTATSFGRLMFGGTTSSFPAIKRSSANLQARLADDSAFTTLEANAVDMHGSRMRVRTSTTIAQQDAAGNAGEWCWDTSYLYICTATNSWARIPLTW